MKHFLLPSLIAMAMPAVQTFAATAPLAATDTPTDSVAPTDSEHVTDLSEVVVQGRTQRVIKYGVEYTPDKRTKKMAMDAVSLLRLMAIPQLDITPGSRSVKMIGNRDVKIFIDYVPATEEDLRGMRTQDVLRVEVLQYPEDPRFESAQYVINYIMQKYAWGGYTTIGGEGNVLNILNGYAYVYSKFVKDKWTFDANAGASGTRIDKNRGSSTVSYRDFNFEGRHIDMLDRTSVAEAGLSTHNGEWASLRAMYNTQTLQIEHRVAFGRSEQPNSDYDSHVEFSDALLPSSESHSRENSLNIDPSIYGRYLFMLPKGNTLSFNWNFNYGHTRRNSSYRLGELAPVINDNREKVYSPNGTLTYSKRFAHRNTFRTSLMTYNSFYDTHYSGSYDGRQKLLSSENMLFIEYMQNWDIGLSLYSRIGMSYVIGRVNGETNIKQWNPRLGLQLQYRINEMNSASISAWWGNSHPGPASSNTAIVQSNELLWLAGNPDLRNTLFQQVDVSYDFIPTNKFSLSFYAKYEGNPHKQAYEYMVIPGYDGLVRRTINSGDAHDWTAVIAGSLRLLDNSLQLTARLSGNRVVLTGIDAQSLNSGYVSANVNYFLGNFSLSAYYSTPRKYLGAWSMGRITTVKNSSYGLSVNYAVGEFKASLSSSNWWNKAHQCTDFVSSHYSEHGWTWSSGMAANICLNLSYTISYGKKVSRDNQIGGSSSAGSAILK